MELSGEAARVERVICEAFAGVSLGDGVGMREADAMSKDYLLQREDLVAERAMDERVSWERMDLADVWRYCDFGWFAFDERGRVFHLPAMMRAVLHDEEDEHYDFLMLRLGEPNDLRDELWVALNRAQRLAVREFMVWAVGRQVFDFDRESYERGLEEFWTLERMGE